jgi:hypothetical protein
MLAEESMLDVERSLAGDKLWRPLEKDDKRSAFVVTTRRRVEGGGSEEEEEEEDEEEGEEEEDEEEDRAAEDKEECDTPEITEVTLFVEIKLSTENCLTISRPPFGLFRAFFKNSGVSSFVGRGISSDLYDLWTN